MPNLSALSSLTTKATALSNLILVSPQSTVGYQPENPLNADGTPSYAQKPPTFVFNYEGEQALTLESDITDHYVENNISVEDQIALKPEIYTTYGYIGELTDIVPDLLKPLKVIADKLTTVVAYAPQQTITAQLAYANALLLYQVGRTAVNSAVSAWSGINNLISGSDGQNVIGSEGLGTQFDFASGRVNGNQNRQQVAFQQMYGYWYNRTLFTIQTPWAVLQNMAISRLRAIQSEETRTITDFEITFKMIRVASTRLGVASYLTQGRARAQSATVTNLGISSPVPGPSLTSMLS